MLYALLAIIAAGVLMMSNEGRIILQVLVAGLGVYVVGLILYYGFILYVAASNTNTGGIIITLIFSGLAIYFITYNIEKGIETGSIKRYFQSTWKHNRKSSVFLIILYLIFLLSVLYVIYR